MSVLNQSGEEQAECPLCMEPLEVDDLHFYPCTCGYQICRFCWNRIREGENGLCPACRKAYPENPADFIPLSQEQVAAIKTEKKAREQKRRNKTLESRRALANVRVVQNNLVFVVGLPVRLADPEILKRQEYFGKYGKIHKVVINQSTTYAGSQGPSASAYVTYVTPADALRAIQGVNNVTLDGRVLKGSLGTTKYCANFMKNQPCPKSDCMYLHELGDSKASFTKEEMHAGLHQVYERKLHNQLLAAQKDKPEEKNQNSSGNSSTNADKNVTKDGNPSNFIPTTVVTSSNINVVNSKSKRDSSGNGSASSSLNGNGSGKEAWPSLGSSPPSDSPARKQSSPKPQQSTVKSQENGTSESSSPTQLQPNGTQQAQTKNNCQDTAHTDSNNKTKSSKESATSTNGHTRRSKNDKSKQKLNSNSVIIINNNDDDTSDDLAEVKSTLEETRITHTPSPSVFDNDTQQNYLTNDLDELESDRHSLLENHDLLDNSDHSLLDDDNTHNLLNDANNDVMMLQKHKEMLAGLVENNHLMPHMSMKSPILNGYGLLDSRDISYLGSDRQISQINQGMMMDQKEILLRDRSRSEMLMRQNEMMARQHSVIMDTKHYMPSSSIGHESASELLGANFHQNSNNMLPPFGMHVVENCLGGGPGGHSISSLGSSATGGYMVHSQMQQNHQMARPGLVNGYDAPHTTNEGRYLAENMDKFFTDFYKAQQLRQLSRASDDRRYREHHPLPHNVVSAERLEMEHKQKMSNMRGQEMGSRAAGDGDDDLDFDPFKETQKAFAELMENEMMHSTVSSGDNMERLHRSRLVPPGFAHLNTFAPPAHQNHHQGYNSGSAMFSDWTQMDPAIMSTSVASGAASNGPLSPQQQVLARFEQLNVGPHQWAGAQRMSWGGPTYGVPLPPGFAPAKPQQRPPECVDAN